jgi:hypothetical protein
LRTTFSCSRNRALSSTIATVFINLIVAENSGINEAEEYAAVPGVNRQQDLVRGGGARNASPICTETSAGRIGLRLECPTQVIRRPEQLDFAVAR